MINWYENVLEILPQKDCKGIKLCDYLRFVSLRCRKYFRSDNKKTKECYKIKKL